MYFTIFTRVLEGLPPTSTDPIYSSLFILVESVGAHPCPGHTGDLQCPLAVRQCHMTSSDPQAVQGKGGVSF